jgi:ABC-type polysaccharide/polyol phosphate export permease
VAQQFSRRTFSLALMLAWEDVRQAYRRSAIGPFWITASMVIQITAMGLVFGIIFKTPLHDYLPYLASSIILWTIIATSVTDGCMSFISGEAMIKQLNISLFVHSFRVVFRNLITLAHNFVIIPLVFLAMWHPIGWQVILFVPGILIVLLNLSWMTVILGMISARFRDVPQIVSSMLTIVYFVTPIMWQPSLVPPAAGHWLLGLNPFYHLLQVMRLPFLSVAPTLENWTLSIALAAVGWAGTMLAFRKFGNQIAYWV